MLPDWFSNLRPDVEFIADKNKKVLIYSGDKDFICNWKGGEAWVDEMKVK